MRARRVGALAETAALAVLAALGTADLATAQTDPDRSGVPEVSLLPDVPFATMSMRLEKTLFQVDVLDLTIRVAESTARALRTATSRADGYRRGLEGAVAQLAIRTPEAVATIEFLRGASLDQFLDGVDDDMRRALDAGWLEPAAYEEIRAGLPRWFAFLEERRIVRGDRLAYHVRGDTLRTVYADRDGVVLLDQTDVGRQNILALLGAYFAPRSSFRRDLIRSLWDEPRR